MHRLAVPALSSALIAAIAVLLLHGGPPAAADVGGVYASVPTFQPGQPITITVTAEDDDGSLTIRSNLAGSALTVTNCTGIGSNQVAGKCDGSGLAAVSGQGSNSVAIDTAVLDTDVTSELLTVTLTLTASCLVATAVTVSADQPGNVGPDDVTINCEPPTPTPTPTRTPTATPTPMQTPVATVPPPPTSTPPAAPPRSEVLTITPPSTGDGGIAR